MRLEEQLELSSAQDETVVDADGRSYYDLTSGWNVTNAGWNNQTIFKSWVERINSLPFRPSWCTDASREALTEFLVTTLPNYFPIYSCSGSEAIDNALKVARMVTGRASVACISNGYHGSTLGASLAAGYEVSHLEPLGLELRRFVLPIPVSDEELAATQRILEQEEDIGAVVFETVLTNAGCFVVPNRFLEMLGQLSQELGFLLICDEIGTGINRTGALWSFQSRSIQPHIVTSGKALTNGLYPLSVAMVANELAPFVDRAAFNSTYGGTPSGCAAALATLSFHKASNLGSRARDLGRTVSSHIETYGRRAGCPIATQGIGLSIAINLRDQAVPSRQQQYLSENLVAELSRRSIFASLSADAACLMITPPLTASMDRLLSALDTVGETIVDLHVVGRRN